MKINKSSRFEPLIFLLIAALFFSAGVNYEIRLFAVWGIVSVVFAAAIFLIHKFSKRRTENVYVPLFFLFAGCLGIFAGLFELRDKLLILAGGVFMAFGVLMGFLFSSEGRRIKDEKLRNSIRMPNEFIVLFAVKETEENDDVKWYVIDKRTGRAYVFTESKYALTDFGTVRMLACSKYARCFMVDEMKKRSFWADFSEDNWWRKLKVKGISGNAGETKPVSEKIRMLREAIIADIQGTNKEEYNLKRLSPQHAQECFSEFKNVTGANIILNLYGKALTARVLKDYGNSLSTVSIKKDRFYLMTQAYEEMKEFSFLKSDREWEELFDERLSAMIRDIHKRKYNIDIAAAENPVQSAESPESANKTFVCKVCQKQKEIKFLYKDQTCADCYKGKAVSSVKPHLPSTRVDLKQKTGDSAIQHTIKNEELVFCFTHQSLLLERYRKHIYQHSVTGEYFCRRESIEAIPVSPYEIRERTIEYSEFMPISLEKVTLLALEVCRWLESLSYSNDEYKRQAGVCRRIIEENKRISDNKANEEKWKNPVCSVCSKSIASHKITYVNSEMYCKYCFDNAFRNREASFYRLGKPADYSIKRFGGSLLESIVKIADRLKEDGFEFVEAIVGGGTDEISHSGVRAYDAAYTDYEMFRNMEKDHAEREKNEQEISGGNIGTLDYSDISAKFKRYEQEIEVFAFTDMLNFKWKNIIGKYITVIADELIKKEKIWKLSRKIVSANLKDGKRYIFGTFTWERARACFPDEPYCDFVELMIDLKERKIIANISSYDGRRDYERTMTADEMHEIAINNGIDDIVFMEKEDDWKTLFDNCENHLRSINEGSTASSVKPSLPSEKQVDTEAKQKLLEAIRKEELEKFLMAAPGYRLETKDRNFPEMNDYSRQFEALNEYGKSNRGFENDLIQALRNCLKKKDKFGVAYHIVRIICEQVQYEKRGKNSMSFIVDDLLKELREVILLNKEELIGYKEWDGRLYEDGMYGALKYHCDFISTVSGDKYKIL